MTIEQINQEITESNIKQLEGIRKTLLVNLFAQLEISVQRNTFWEQVTCVGFNPQSEQLEAVISIKQSTGYSGSLCSNGSTEYIRFFIDWGDGAGFQNVGLTSFQAHDISDLPPGPQHPLQYVVYLPLNDNDHRKCCKTAVIPKVRAVLAWNQVPPIDPNYIPPFGNHVDANVQLQPAPTSLACLIDEGILQFDPNLLEPFNLKAALPQADPKPVPWSQLVTAYRKLEVPDHRLVYEAVQPMLHGGQTLAQVSAQKDISLVKQLGIDISKVIEALTIPQFNKTFEELACIGLNTASDTLGAVIHIKKPSGYSGSLCQLGSREYIAFWADWDNNGSFDEYLGTTSVTVHDIATLPAGGLYYAVLLPVNLTQRLKACGTPNIVRIRAVLSWSAPPSTIDPNAINYWGDRRDAVVQIRPGNPSDKLLDLLYDIGNVPIADISPLTHLANPSTGILNPNNCAQPALDRPFGGAVRIGGRIYNTGLPGTVHYQVQYTPHGTSNWLPVTQSHTFELMHPDPLDPKFPKELVTKNSPDGWFPYLENPLASPPILERTAALASWSTGALEGEYDLRLAYTKDYPITPSSVIYYSQPPVTIVLDNTNYTVSPTPNSTVDLAYSLDLVIDGGDCHKYDQGEGIHGHLRALDQHFWHWVLELQPTTHTNGTQASPSCRSYGSLVDQGDGNAAWTLDTSKMDKCGYTLTLRAYDRTIVDSNGAIVHSNSKAIGFSVV